MKQETYTIETNAEKTRKGVFICLIIGTFLIYYFSNPNPQSYYDYTYRVAENVLRGAIAFQERPPGWLNEFVPFEGNWYSVFPLGSVLTMMPFAFFKLIGVIYEMPASFIAALTAGAICWFLAKISEYYELERKKRILLVCGILFGTWMWTNLTMAGAWQLALGFAMLGELGAIYFTVFNRRPLLAGLFFAIAFGNRTEILLTAPVFMFLLFKSQVPNSKSQVESEPTRLKQEELKVSETKKPEDGLGTWNLKLGTLVKFCAVPFILGVLTLIYNYVRFHSFADFGYARIPGVLNEPWYRYGIFSIWYIPLNFMEMLVAPWRWLGAFPYFVPSGFGGAIWWSSPFLIFLFRFGARDRILKYTAWAAIFIVTFLLWIHGNPGGWQFGYRYAMILLPWMFIILLENSPKKIRWYEWLAYIFSFFVNLYATYLFFWTDYIKP
ncbi:MAG TPA: hypothetical protein VNB22_20050 [Pyrinomonadaceae bacterium]|nr:hypothetical protein [Pyrinomonadaceae bacterium]